MTPPRTAVGPGSAQLPVDRTRTSTAEQLLSAAPAAGAARPAPLVAARHPDRPFGTVAAARGRTSAPPAARAAPLPHTPSHRTDHPSR